MKDVAATSPSLATSTFIYGLNAGTTYYLTLYTQKSGTWASTQTSFQAGTASVAQFLSPQNEAVLPVGASVQFSWTTVPAASAYSLQVGTAPGGYDIHASMLTANTFSLNLQPNRYYASIYTMLNGVWSNPSSTVFDVGGLANLSYPPEGAANVGSVVHFTWAPVANAQKYILYVGSNRGLNDLYNSGQTTTASAVVALPPIPMYYARLYTYIGGIWMSCESTFRINHASLTYPLNGDPDVNTQGPFTWQPANGAQSYSLALGTSAGATNVFSTGPTTATNTLVSGLSSGVTYYATLGTLTAAGWVYENTTFTAGIGPALLLAPRDLATAVDPNAAFTWTPIANVQYYALWVGSKAGGSDVFASGETSLTSMTVPGLAEGHEYYVRLFTVTNGITKFVDSTFTAGSGMANLLSPVPGSANFDPQAPFTWSTFPGAQAYELKVGTSSGGNNMFDTGSTTQTSQVVPGLVSGTLYYVRLLTEVAGQWRYTDYQFTAGTALAHMIYPADGAVGVDGSDPFLWSTVSDAQLYVLFVGTAPGLDDVNNSGGTLANSYLVKNLAPGKTYYLTLYTEKNGVWLYSNSSFTAGSPDIAHFTYPVPSESDVDPFGTFTWTTVPDGQTYRLYIGTTLGAKDVYEGPDLASSQVTPKGLGYGRTYYARLFTVKYGVWLFTDITFQTIASDKVSNLDTLQAQYEQKVRSLTASVRMMVNWPGDTAVPGTPMASYLALQGKQSAYCTDFTYILLKQFVSANIAARARSIFLTGTRSESHSIIEYWDPFLDNWVITDPTFGLIFTDENVTVGQSVEDINQLVLAKQFGGIHIQYLTGYGDSIPRDYYMDMITYYTNYSQPCLVNCPFYGYSYLDNNGNFPSQYATQNPPEEFLIPQPATIEGIPGLYVFKFTSTSDAIQIVNGSTTMTVTPMNNTLFSYSTPLQSGWTMSGSAVIVYTFDRPMFPAN